MPLRAGFYRKEGGDLRNCGKEEPGMKQLTRILQDSWKSPVRSSQEAWNVGAGSGYGRDRQARWDAREMRTATTKVRREVYEEFRRLCQEQRTTPYAVLQDFLLAFVDHFGETTAPAAEVRDKPPFTGWHSSS